MAGSVRFSAATDQIAFIGAGLPDPAAGWTLTMWIKVAVDTDDSATFARTSGDAGTTATLATTIGGLGGPIYATGGGVITGGGLTVLDWYRFAVSATGGTGNVYLAHDLAGPTALTSGAVSGAASPTQICFGGRSMADSTERLNGNVAYPKLYSAVLSQAEIEAEWLATAPVITSNLTGFWPLTSAADLTDHSGNGRHLAGGATLPTTEDGPPIATTVAPTAFLSFL